MSNLTARVAVGVPVYNGERYLAHCLDSLLAQTFDDLDIIVCDNASTDRTPEIACTYAERDGRVRYHRNPVNIGCPRNFTRSFELARAPYFRWASADDLSAPTFIERCVEVLEAHGEVVQAYPRTLVIDGEGNVMGEQVDYIHAVEVRPSDRYMAVTRRLGRCNAIYGVMRSDVLRRTAILKPYIGSDIPLQAELALYGAIWEVPEPLFFRRMHARAQSAMSDDERARHYDPAAARRQTSSLWRHLYERARGTLRAPIPWSEKRRVASFLARDAVMSRDGFAAELRVQARRWLGAVAMNLIIVLAACGAPAGHATTGRDPMTVHQVSGARLEAAARRRIFFGHQSVGGNIIAGVRALIDSDPALRLRIVHTSEPWTVDGPALMEAEIGRNGDPAGKTRAFEQAVAHGLDESGAVAFHKYCYIDMTPNTDVDQLFANYRTAMRELARMHPLVTFAHVTMPLAVDDAPPAKRFVKRLVGRDMALMLNQKRNHFNQLLRAEYDGREPVFDLARLESTHPDGSRSFLRAGNDTVFTLAAEYSYDGGHLTPDAERRIGRAFLQFLADLPLPVGAVAQARR